MTLCRVTKKTEIQCSTTAKAGKISGFLLKEGVFRVIHAWDIFSAPSGPTRAAPPWTTRVTRSVIPRTTRTTIRGARTPGARSFPRSVLCSYALVVVRTFSFRLRDHSKRICVLQVSKNCHVCHTPEVAFSVDPFQKRNYGKVWNCQKFQVSSVVKM